MNVRTLLLNWLLIFKKVLIFYNLNYTKKWVKVFKNRPSKIKFVEDSLLKIWIYTICLGRPYKFKFFKGCLPQILLGPFLMQNAKKLLIFYNLNYTKKWVKVFKNRPSKIKFVEDSLLKIWIYTICLGRPYKFKFFKGCLPQILLGPILMQMKSLHNDKYFP